MYKNKAPDGRNNICGKNITKYRKNLVPPPSQRAFAEILQRAGIDVDKNAVQRIESGSRFVTDIELKIIAQVLEISLDDLLAID